MYTSAPTQTKTPPKKKLATNRRVQKWRFYVDCCAPTIFAPPGTTKITDGQLKRSSSIIEHKKSSDKWQLDRGLNCTSCVLNLLLIAKTFQSITFVVILSISLPPSPTLSLSLSLSLNPNVVHSRHTLYLLTQSPPQFTALAAKSIFEKFLLANPCSYTPCTLTW